MKHGDPILADMTARIERLEARREIEELDAAWARHREQLMDRDGDGKLREPGRAVWLVGGLAFLGAGAIAAFWGASIGMAFAAIGLALLLFGVPHAIKRQRHYRAELAAYNRRREKLRADPART